MAPNSASSRCLRQIHWRICCAGVLFWIGWVAPVEADAPYSELLERYNKDIREHPQNYLKRVERASFVLENGNAGSIPAEDIDTLLSHPEWVNEGNCLKAVRLKLQGRLDEAEILIRKNIRNKMHVLEQSRLLAILELSKKDTAAALAAYRLAWDQNHDENDYLDLLNLYRGRGAPPEELLKQGPQLYPRSPGAMQTIYEVYFAAGDSTSLRNCLEISNRAEKTLWPRSIDWKIRHAETLLSLKRPHEAEPVLMSALDLLDDDARLQNESGEAFRKKIFNLLETARNPHP